MLKNLVCIESIHRSVQTKKEKQGATG